MTKLNGIGICKRIFKKRTFFYIKKLVKYHIIHVLYYNYNGFQYVFYYYCTFSPVRHSWTTATSYSFPLWTPQTDEPCRVNGIITLMRPAQRSPPFIISSLDFSPSPPLLPVHPPPCPGSYPPSPLPRHIIYYNSSYIFYYL